MRRISEVNPPVVVEFTFEEAKKLSDSLLDDFQWDETSQPHLYQQLYSILDEAAYGGSNR